MFGGLGDVASFRPSTVDAAGFVAVHWVVDQRAAECSFEVATVREVALVLDPVRLTVR